MSRRKRATVRNILPDPKYNDVLVSKFINCLLRKGKKSTAERIFYRAVDLMSERTKKDGLELFHQALENAKPKLEVKSRRVGGSTYQVPIEVRSQRQQALAIRWLINFAKTRHEKTMAANLASELIAAANNEGPTIKKKEDTLKMAEANRAFAHFRW
ncbi:MAG TPA: 30S ribosomal protein S7 [Bacteroidetes bacterium]|nr:30S ribosomal protein S7 [Bacteroidota bacterium]